MQSSSFQHTLKAPVSIMGVGLHSGAPARLKLKPAPADTGIVFVRVDIADRDNAVPARWDHVADTRMHTVLANKAGVTVSTVEHLLAGCAAVGLDNAVIEIDGPEIPIMDGSAMEFIDALDSVGLTRQNTRRRELRIRKTVSYQEGDKEVFLSPAAGSFYSFEIVFDNAAIGRQKYSHEFREGPFRHEIAPARTFGFFHEAEQLRKMGLARGATLGNAVVFDGENVLNPGGLRFPNECVRHKILDAVGDIYLCGMRMMGHYHGFKAGHAMTNKILHVLFSQPDAFEIVEAETEVREMVAAA